MLILPWKGDAVATAACCVAHGINFMDDMKSRLGLAPMMAAVLFGPVLVIFCDWCNAARWGRREEHQSESMSERRRTNPLVGSAIRRCVFRPVPPPIAPPKTPASGLARVGE